MNVLSIGNSFSRDAQRYVHGIARASGTEINVFNLFIGGCPLSRHYRNMLSGAAEYTLDVNGYSTGFKVSLDEALLNRDWDVITLQQVSTKSVSFDSYQPYLDALAEYVRRCAPKARLVIHQTWAYADGSSQLAALGYTAHEGMLADLKKAYECAAQAIDADFIIPSGSLFGELTHRGVGPLHRDACHASLGLGRYALGLLWYAVLMGSDVADNTFCDFDEEIANDQIALVKECVTRLVK